MDKEMRRIYDAVDDLLWKEWDPIGVNDAEEARDEYHNYVPEVFRRKIQGPTPEKIASYLFEVETEKMGLFGSKAHCRMIAEKVVLL